MMCSGIMIWARESDLHRIITMLMVTFKAMQKVSTGKCTNEQFRNAKGDYKCSRKSKRIIKYYFRKLSPNKFENLKEMTNSLKIVTYYTWFKKK